MDERNVFMMSEDIHSFDQCPEHETDPSFADPIDMEAFLPFFGRQCRIEAAGEDGYRVSLG